MKKILLILFIFTTLGIHAQSENEYETTDFHEPKLNIGYMILGNFDVTYEYLISQESGVGLNLMVPFDDYIEWNIKYNFTGFYRFYFTDNYADGIFAETFLNLNQVEDEINDDINGGKKDKNITDLAIGLGVGYKLVSGGGVILEAHLGGGRNLFSDYNSERNFDFVLRAGINVGYRF
ncbi:hypothetical protein [Psychroflexus aestuariivivens]|uniref:hypothetical protein n=1 Tax=Psychroflexus aestuariivivens TaxID=1795040 RepID=UPI000FDBB370|nr:hypothetical protein [Psychroflexus aestuariivivens]